MIMAHRGASAFAPENTLAAIRKAVELGASGIEIDIQMSRDGELLLFHDWNLERIAGDSSLFTEKNSSELRKIDAGKWFSEEYEGEKIPFLGEVINSLPKGKGFLVNIELKKTASDTRDAESVLVRHIRNSGIADDVIVSSFNYRSIERIGKIDPGIKTALITCACYPDPMRYFSIFRCYSIHPVFYYVDREFVDTMHSNNIRVYPWVVDSALYAKALDDMGCDGIITNRPGALF